MQCPLCILLMTVRIIVKLILNASVQFALSDCNFFQKSIENIDIPIGM